MPAPASVPKDAKLAHLFLVGANLHQEALWEEFFGKADDNAFSIYVHPKWPERVTTRLFRDRVISGLCPTHYGHISLVEAELRLLRAAMSEERNQFFLLHSESCVPIRPFSQVYREICEIARSWLNYGRRSVGRFARVDQRAVPEWQFYKASQFFCLTRRHVELILAHGDLTAWRRAWVPDEHYFPTTLAICGALGDCARRNLTFADWDPLRSESGWGPTVIHRLTPGDVAKLRATDCLFARKFAADSDVARHIGLATPDRSRTRS